MGRELSSSLAESTASSGLILVLKLVQSSPGSVDRGGFWRVWGSFGALSLVGGRLASSVSPVGAYSVKRSELRTVLDGEFDWGGTSVKR